MVFTGATPDVRIREMDDYFQRARGAELPAQVLDQAVTHFGSETNPLVLVRLRDHVSDYMAARRMDLEPDQAAHISRKLLSMGVQNRAARPYVLEILTEPTHRLPLKQLESDELESMLREEYRFLSARERSHSAIENLSRLWDVVYLAGYDIRRSDLYGESSESSFVDQFVDEIRNADIFPNLPPLSRTALSFVDELERDGSGYEFVLDPLVSLASRFASMRDASSLRPLVAIYERVHNAFPYSNYERRIQSEILTFGPSRRRDLVNYLGSEVARAAEAARLGGDATLGGTLESKLRLLHLDVSRSLSAPPEERLSYEITLPDGSRTSLVQLLTDIVVGGSDGKSSRLAMSLIRDLVALQPSHLPHVRRSLVRKMDQLNAQMNRVLRGEVAFDADTWAGLSTHMNDILFLIGMLGGDGMVLNRLERDVQAPPSVQAIREEYRPTVLREPFLRVLNYQLGLAARRAPSAEANRRLLTVIGEAMEALAGTLVAERVSRGRYGAYLDFVRRLLLLARFDHLDPFTRARFFLIASRLYFRGLERRNYTAESARLPLSELVNQLDTLQRAYVLEHADSYYEMLGTALVLLYRSLSFETRQDVKQDVLEHLLMIADRWAGSDIPARYKAGMRVYRHIGLPERLVAVVGDRNRSLNARLYALSVLKSFTQPGIDVVPVADRTRKLADALLRLREYERQFSRDHWRKMRYEDMKEKQAFQETLNALDAFINQEITTSRQRNQNRSNNENRPD